MIYKILLQMYSLFCHIYASYILYIYCGTTFSPRDIFGHHLVFIVFCILYFSHQTQHTDQVHCPNELYKSSALNSVVFI